VTFLEPAVGGGGGGAIGGPGAAGAERTGPGGSGEPAAVVAAVAVDDAEDAGEIADGAALPAQAARPPARDSEIAPASRTRPNGNHVAPPIRARPDGDHAAPSRRNTGRDLFRDRDMVAKARPTLDPGAGSRGKREGVLSASLSMPCLIAVNPHNPDRGALAEAARVLRAGGIVAFPTETVYGLGALALDERALARLYEAKGRPPHHPLIAHVDGEAQARALARSWPETAARLASAFWPGPLTLVVERAGHVSAALAGGASSIALRVPSHAVARALLAVVGEPVAAPSANRYQGLSPTTAAHVIKQLGDRVDLVLDGGPCDAGIESTVVDVRVDPPRVLRPGALGIAALTAIAPDLQAHRRDPDAGETRASPGMDARHYAPRAPLHVAPTREAAVSLARAIADRQGKPVGVIVREPTAGEVPVVPARLALRVLSGEASGYARLLFATLHDLDDEGVCAIVVHAVPDDPAWWAVADRLARGSTSAG
jgi:L-threonylcarbamoyladenylate synthase